MRDETRGTLLREVGRLGGAGTVAGLGEGELLARFVARGDEAAFEAILVRHGPMVLGVCRRRLADPHDVDDAFQATFLVLARKASAIRPGAAVGPWLHGVARRVAARAGGDARRRRDRERGDDSALRDAPAAVGPGEPGRLELRWALDEELGRLPESYRAPIVLCYLQGRTHDEAAAQLGWPVGTVRGRLARARDRLRGRLIGRGLAPAGGAMALLGDDAFAAAARAVAASATVPWSLSTQTIRAATRVAAGEACAVGVLSARAAGLSRGVIRTMTASTLIKPLTGLAAAAGVLVAGAAGVSARQDGPGQAAGATTAPAASAPAAPSPSPTPSSTPAPTPGPTPFSNPTPPVDPPPAAQSPSSSIQTEPRDDTEPSRVNPATPAPGGERSPFEADPNPPAPPANRTPFELDQAPSAAPGGAAMRGVYVPQPAGGPRTMEVYVDGVAEPFTIPVPREVLRAMNARASSASRGIPARPTPAGRPRYAQRTPEPGATNPPGIYLVDEPTDPTSPLPAPNPILSRGTPSRGDEPIALPPVPQPANTFAPTPLPQPQPRQVKPAPTSQPRRGMRQPEPAPAAVSPPPVVLSESMIHNDPEAYLDEVRNQVNAGIIRLTKVRDHHRSELSGTETSLARLKALQEALGGLQSQETLPLPDRSHRPNSNDPASSRRRGAGVNRPDEFEGPADEIQETTVLRQPGEVGPPPTPAEPTLQPPPAPAPPAASSPFDLPADVTIPTAPPALGATAPPPPPMPDGHADQARLQAVEKKLDALLNAIQTLKAEVSAARQPAPAEVRLPEGVPSA